HAEVAGKGSRAADHGNERGEGEWPRQQPLRDGGAGGDNGGGVNQQHLAGSVEPGAGFRVGARGGKRDAGSAHQAGERGEYLPGHYPRSFISRAMAARNSGMPVPSRAGVVRMPGNKAARFLVAASISAMRSFSSEAFG